MFSNPSVDATIATVRHIIKTVYGAIFLLTLLIISTFLGFIMKSWTCIVSAFPASIKNNPNSFMKKRSSNSRSSSYNIFQSIYSYCGFSSTSYSSSNNEDDEFVEDDRERSDHSAERRSSSPSLQLSSLSEKKVLHMCVLVHGHKGNHRDLSYMKSALLLQAQKHKKNSSSDFIVLSSTCNEEKTDDGVIKGGVRLTDEILDFLKHSISSYPSLTYITLSLIGNSLGGLYSRFALMKLHEQLCHEKLNIMYFTGSSSSLNKKLPLYFNVFCSTATPHLGVSKHTYVPIPRPAESIIARIMGQTGEDLFRFNNLLKNMATSKEYLEPLRKFKKRVAFANAYGTDFPVPFHTAAFLNPLGSSKYQLEHVFQDDIIVASVHTLSDDNITSQEQRDKSFSESEDELVTMCSSLDSLGWKKIFVDLRKNIPLFVPLLSNTSTKVLSLKEKQIVTSKDLSNLLGRPMDKICLPIGHNMIVAFSRDPVSALIHRGGRPVMDTLAEGLIHEIHSWKQSENYEDIEEEEENVAA